MPDGVRWLRARGVDLDPAASRRFAGIRYLDGDASAEARFVEGYGLGIRRPALHRALVARAEQVGVRLEWGVRALGLTGDALETSAGVERPDWLIGADGLGSRMRRWAGLDGGSRPRQRRTGIRRHYRLAPWTDVVEVHWSDGCEAYVTPVSPAEIGVAILWSGEARGFDDGLERFPRLAERLTGAATASSDRGAGPLWRRARSVHRGRLALIGDAAGYLDAITGEGLALGFHQAEALAEAVRAGDLALYERAFAKLAALPFTLIRLLLFAERHPAIRSRMVRTLAGEPELFAQLLAIHARDRPPASLGLGGAFRFVRGWVRA